MHRTPSYSTIRRILILVCPGGLADLLGCDPAGAAPWPWTARPPAAHAPTSPQPPTFFRCARRRTHRQPDKTTEVTGFTRPLDLIGLVGVVVTADALHTHRGHAKWLAEKKAHYVFVVKRNQPHCTMRCEYCHGRR